MDSIAIIFGDGDAGGFRIINGKVERIPGNNPETFKQLNGLSKLVAAESYLKDSPVAGAIKSVAQELSSSILEQFGGTNKGGGLVFVSEYDDAIYCGSTGVVSIHVGPPRSGGFSN